MDTNFDVFLGGTTNDSKWRDLLIEKVAGVNPEVKCFNPVVDDWTPECIVREEQVKLNAIIHVYVLTPNMVGPYSVAELIQSSHLKDTLFCILEKDVLADGTETVWDPKVRKSLDAVAKMATENKAVECKNFDTMANYIAALYILK